MRAVLRDADDRVGGVRSRKLNREVTRGRSFIAAKRKNNDRRITRCGVVVDQRAVCRNRRGRERQVLTGASADSPLIGKLLLINGVTAEHIHINCSNGYKENCINRCSEPPNRGQDESS